MDQLTTVVREDQRGFAANRATRVRLVIDLDRHGRERSRCRASASLTASGAPDPHPVDDAVNDNPPPLSRTQIGRLILLFSNGLGHSLKGIPPTVSGAATPG
jgi:hypothetical protein